MEESMKEKKILSKLQGDIDTSLYKELKELLKI